MTQPEHVQPSESKWRTRPWHLTLKVQLQVREHACACTGSLCLLNHPAGMSTAESVSTAVSMGSVYELPHSEASHLDRGTAELLPKAKLGINDIRVRHYAHSSEL